MNLRPHSIRQTAQSAFTMIEIAISMGIVAFALVAILGVLPTGLDVQSRNEEETIINQESTLILEALRGGNTNMWDLLSNFEWMVFQNQVQSNYLTYNNPILYPAQIIGLLSTPKYENGNTNLIQVRFLANSGNLVERSPVARNSAFSYLLTSEILPFANSGSTDPNLSSNLWNVRLTFQWPVLSSPTNVTGLIRVGSGKKVVRAVLAGRLVRSDGLGQPDPNGSFYFFNPGLFDQAFLP